MAREDFQTFCADLNSAWTFDPALQVAPDGDAELSWDQISDFKEPVCPECSSPVRPDIVFFGDNVPRPIVRHASDQLLEADAVMVFGSSLQVINFSVTVVQAIG